MSVALRTTLRTYTKCYKCLGWRPVNQQSCINIGRAHASGQQRQPGLGTLHELEGAPSRALRLPAPPHVPQHEGAATDTRRVRHTKVASNGGALIGGLPRHSYACMRGKG